MEDYMKMKLLLPAIGTLVFVVSCMGIPKMSMGMPSMKMEIVATSFTDGNPPGKAEEIIQNQDIVEVDTIAFETDDYLGIRQKLGQEFATYQRIPNLNYKVSSAKLFTTNGKEFYTLVPQANQAGVHIHIKNNLGRKGKIDIIASPEMNFTSMIIQYTINTDFFGRPYTFHIYANSELTAGVSSDQKTYCQFILYYENNPVMAYISIYNLKQPANNRTTIVADHEFLKNNENDAAAWCIIFVLLQEVNQKMAEESSRQNMHTPDHSMPEIRHNTDGSIDHNRNPLDSF
jgi:hypothetical protein